MSSARGRRPKSFLKRFLTAPRASSPTVTQEASVEPVNLVNPIDAYYRHKAQNHLRALYRFALQSRSLAIRDVFAKASSTRNLDLADLLSVIDHHPVQALSSEERESLAGVFDSSILLALADLLANTARDELDTYGAVKIYNFVHQIYGEAPFSKQQILLYVEALNDVRQYEEVERLADKCSVNDIAPLQRELLNLQRVRYTGSSITEWVNTLNELYAALGLTQVKLLDDESAPYMDRLASNGEQSIDGPKVSVIMPTFSPGPGIRTAVRGLLEQTWQNLEIIIVDDASPKEYRPIFEEVAQLDPRIRVLHQETNHGAYVARNAGLAVATGEFVTTADDDDWSHPDKITIQVSAMLDNPSIVATTSGHVRTTENLELRRLNSSAKFLQMNYSSLMFRAQIVNEIGEWDTVNRGADSEFLSRVTEYYGRDKILRLLDKPLGLSRVRSGSLTAGEMYRGFIGTPRVLYLWAIRQWRWDLGKIGAKPTRSSNSPRPYPIPSNLEAGKRKTNLGLFDVIYVTDVFRQAKHIDSVVTEIETLSNRGLRVGYVHLDSPTTATSAGLPKRLLQLQLQQKVSQVSLEDQATSKLTVVYDPAVGMFADQIHSSITTCRGVVVDKGIPVLHNSERRDAVNYSTVLKNLDRAFETNFEIVGATRSKQQKLHERVNKTRILPDKWTWLSHIQQSPARIEPPTGKPVVGFHSFGNKYRWPSSVSTFRQVYLSGSFDTRFSGQVGPALEQYGSEVLKSAQIVDFNVVPTEDFLSDLHFWIYYPHWKLQDDIWEPVLEAMMAGKVVVLPPHLKQIYGNAAVYGEPQEVKTIVLEFSKNPQEYLHQAKLGQNFVDTLFSADAFHKRMADLIAE